MIRRTFTRTALAALALPLALGLAGCGDKTETAAGPSGEKVAPIAAPAGKSWAETVVKTPEGGYLMGNPDAPIKLVEFGALSCSHCAEFSENAAAELRDDYVASGRVSYELRFFMLNILDVAATLLATCGTTEAVHPLSDQFWAWQPNMFDNLQKAGDQFQQAGQLPPEQRFAAIARMAGMVEFFNARGISADQAQTCLSNTAKASELAAATEKATQQYNITGTPSFLLNGTKLDVNTWEGVETALQNAGAR